MRYPSRFGNYLLLERVNVGGMAEVFKAKKFGVEGFQRILAIKRILPNMSEDQEFINMFVDEARLAVQLNHANIVQIDELGKFENQFYIAMEYVAGKDVRRIVEGFRRRKEPMPVPLAAYICARICEGLDYAHRKNDAKGEPLMLVHRDVSPQNILVSFEGDVKIIDFGIAKAADRLSKTQAGVLKGKFGYMSPEQVAGAPIDRRSDLFAVGVILYEMLTCSRLFVAESDLSTLDKVRRCEVPPMRDFNAAVPDDLEGVVQKALAKNVEERYQWCSDFNEDLQRFLITDQSIFNSKRMAIFMRETFKDDIAEEMTKMQGFLKITQEDLRDAEGAMGGVSFGDGGGALDASQEATQIFAGGDDPLASGATRVAEADAGQAVEAEQATSIQHPQAVPGSEPSLAATSAGAAVDRQTNTRKVSPEVGRPSPDEARKRKIAIIGAAVAALLIIVAAVRFSLSSPSDDVATSLFQLTPPIVPAELFIDQKSVARGMTPFDSVPLSVGRHKVRVVSQNFEDLESEIEVERAKTNIFSLKLAPKSAQKNGPSEPKPSEPKPGETKPGETKSRVSPETPPPGANANNVPPPAEGGAVAQAPADVTTLFVDSEPSGAQVSAGGKKMGVTPYRIEDLAKGTTLHLELRKAGFRPYVEDVRLQGDDKVNVKLVRGERAPKSEQKGLGYMVVNTPGDPDTRVVVDGRDTKRATPVTPQDPLKLAPGPHAVTLVFNDGTRRLVQVSISAGEVFRLIQHK